MIATLGAASMVVMGISFFSTILFLLIQGIFHVDVSKILSALFSTFLVSLTLFFLAVTIGVFNPLTLFLEAISLISTILWIKKHSKHNIDKKDNNDSTSESEQVIIPSVSEHNQQKEKQLEKEDSLDGKKQQPSIDHIDMPTKALPDVELNKILLTPNIHKIRRKLFDFVVFDIETTGLNKQDDEIIQISAVKFIKDKKVDIFDSFISLSRHSSLPLKITMLTGIHDEDLGGAPNISDVLNKFDKFIQDLPLVGHNIERFDIPFLINNGFYRQDIETLDTWRIARSKDIDVPNLKLPTLKNYFGIQNKSHNALEDCVTNAIVYRRLRDNKLEKVEIDTSELSKNLTGLRFAITGQFEGVPREDIIDQIKFHGGRYTKSVSGLTNYLIVGVQTADNISADGISGNEKRALQEMKKRSNLKIIDLEEFNNMLDKDESPIVEEESV